MFARTAVVSTLFKKMLVNLVVKEVEEISIRGIKIFGNGLKKYPLVTIGSQLNQNASCAVMNVLCQVQISKT